MVSIYCLLFIFIFCIDCNASRNSVKLLLLNKFKSPVNLYWIDNRASTASLVSQTSKPLSTDRNFEIDSFKGHDFVVISSIDFSVNVTFTKLGNDEVVTVMEDSDGKMVLKQTTEKSLLTEKVLNLTKSCNISNRDTYFECIANELTPDLKRIKKSRRLASRIQEKLATKLRDYTCQDDSMLTTKVTSRVAHTLSNGEEIIADNLLELPSANIWKIENFVTPDECELFMNHARPNLERATVVGDDGGAEVSDTRRAQHANYDFYLETRDRDALWPLYNRILEAVNLHAGYDLHPDGQEDFSIIQYSVNDEYIAHCDGSCDGTQYRPGGRVATAILYCKVAEKGGGTSFTKSDVFVRPSNGSATFFSYRGQDGIMDDGYTEHSGCPVLQGEKWIITAWMREGVSIENPADNFDPDGNLIEDLDDNSDDNDDEVVDEEDTENFGTIEEEVEDEDEDEDEEVN